MRKAFCEHPEGFVWMVGYATYVCSLCHERYLGKRALGEARRQARRLNDRATLKGAD